MVAFQTLGELSTHLDSIGATLDVVDPGVPLLAYTGAGYVDEAAILRNQPAVRKVTSFIARHVARVPLHFYERVSDTDRRRVTDGEVALALREPAPRVSPFHFWRDVVMDYLIHDRFCIVHTYEAGRLTLTRIPARRCQMEGDGLGRLVKVKVATSDGQTLELDPSVLIAEFGYTARGEVGGISPIETLRDLLDESTEAVAYRRNLWRTSARIPFVVERPAEAKWSGEARTRFLRGLAEFGRRGAREGKALLLEDGMKATKLEAFKPSDVLDLDGRKLTEIEVATAYHVPPELIGAREGTYSNVESFRQSLYGDVLGPWFVMFEQALNAQLLPDIAAPADTYIEYALEASVRGSLLEQIKAGQTAVGAPFMTRNEYRAKLNMGAIDGGDELIVPLNVLEGGQASPTDVEGRPEE